MKRWLPVALLLLVVLATMLLVRSAWLAQGIRNRIIANIERSTGSRAELADYSIAWWDRSITLRGLTLHGSEPMSGPPLFHVSRLHVRLKASSILAGRLGVQAIEADRPSVYVLAMPDGSTNLPALHSGDHSNIADLVQLHVRSVSIHDGVFRVNNKQVPFTVDASGFAFDARYDRRSKTYDLELKAASVQGAIAGVRQPQVGFLVAGQLNARQFTASTISASIGHSRVTAAGRVVNLTHPDIDLHVVSHVDALDIAKSADLSWLKHGLVNLEGEFRSDPASGWAFNGSASGSDVLVNYESQRVHVGPGRFVAKVFATADLIDVSELTANALGGAAKGDLRFENLERMTFRGTVERLDARAVLALVITKPAPFTAAVSGPVSLDTHLGMELTETRINAAVEVQSADGPNGHVSLVYDQTLQDVTFGDSEAAFPHSKASFSGALRGALKLDAETTHLAEVRPILDWLDVTLPHDLQLSGPGAEVRFTGEIGSALEAPQLSAVLHARNVRLSGRDLDSADVAGSVSATAFNIKSLHAESQGDHIQGIASGSLRKWRLQGDSELSLHGVVQSSDFARLARGFDSRWNTVRDGRSNISFDLKGTASTLAGTAVVAISDFSVADQPFTQLRAAVNFAERAATIRAAQLRWDGGLATLQGTYEHAAESWLAGRLQLRVDSNRFPLQRLAIAKQRMAEGLAARTEVHASGNVSVKDGHILPLSLNGSVALHDISLGAVKRGDLSIDAATVKDSLTVGVAGSLDGSPVYGNLHATLNGDDPGSGELRFEKVSLATTLALLAPHQKRPDLAGAFSGRWRFSGPLANWEQLTTKLEVRAAQLQSDAGGTTWTVANEGPVVIESHGPLARITQCTLTTRDTRAILGGNFNVHTGALNLKLNGALDLRMAQVFLPEARTAGKGQVAVSVAGTTDNPLIQGSLRISDGSLILPDLNNTFTGVSGTVQFDRTRASLSGMTAKTGGGTVKLGGIVSFGGTQALAYNLDASASHVRFRYLGASITGDASLQMAGSRQNGLVSGTVTLDRVVLEPGADLANLIASAAIPAATPANRQEFLSGLGFDVHIQSAPDLQVVASLSQNVEASIDLHLRGTRERPVLLGQISANQGEVNVMGTRYTLTRGNVSFVNPVRIDPVLDLDLQTETRGITVDVIVSGTVNKLNMTYRSDPPLQAKDILALLTVGQTPSFAPESSNSRIQTDTSALQAGATTVLGQAISPASNRLTKLFGITNVKIDPFIQNEHNNRQARLTLQQQISRNITVTYVTNLAQTSEQIFRFEWAFNPQYSLVAVRDDNGEFGVDIQYKKRFK